MQYSYPTAAMLLFAATTAISSPLPLNINMGAYSPALVVGDGAIGFKGAESVAQIINTLEGAAASSATANGAAAPVVVESTPSSAAASVEPTTAAAEEPQGMGKKVVSRDLDVEIGERDIEIDYRT